MKTQLLVFLAILAVGTGLRAGPLDEQIVAAEAQWLVHVDLDSLREAPQSRGLVAIWMQAEPARSHLAAVREALGLDPVGDLRSMTLYGKELVPDRGVLIVRAAWDKPRLAAFLARQPDYAEKKQDGRSVFTWTERRGGQRQTVFAAFHGEEYALISSDAADLTAALEVLDGRAGGLAGSGSALAGSAPEGTILLVRAGGLSEAKLALKSPILLLSETLSLTAGETADGAFAEVRLTAASADHVPHFRDVAAGLVALARLMRAGDDDVLKLLDAVTISTDDRTISARWTGPLIDVIQALNH